MPILSLGFLSLKYSTPLVGIKSGEIKSKRVFSLKREWSNRIDWRPHPLKKLLMVQSSPVIEEWAFTFIDDGQSRSFLLDDGQSRFCVYSTWAYNEFSTLSAIAFPANL